jgi:hypothetical protein
MDKAVGKDVKWVKELQPTFKTMRAKLTKYYDKTAIPFVHGDGME